MCGPGCLPLTALALSGVTAGLSWLWSFQSPQQGPVSRVAAIIKLSVVLVALVGVSRLGEELDSKG